MNRIRCCFLLLCLLGALTLGGCYSDDDNNINPIPQEIPQEISQENPSQNRQLASLAEKWNITGPVQFNYTTLIFSLTYQVSDFILNGMIQEQRYDQNCAEGGNVVSSTYLTSQVTPDASVPPGNGNSSRSVGVQITLDPNTISASNIYSEAMVNNSMIATIRFCHRFMLFTNGSSTPVEVNFRETLVTLTVNLTDGYDIGTIAVAEKDKLVQTANAAYQVEGFQCDPANNIALTELELASTRAQGTIFRVCVRPDAEARADGIFMRSIDSFVFQRDYGGSIGIVTQPAIESGLPASNQLTQLFCNSGNQVCAFETVLKAVFYQLPGSVDGTGIATMQFGSQALSRRRQLLRTAYDPDGMYDPRSLQEVAAVSEFDLTMELVPRSRPQTSGDSRSLSKGATAILFLLQITIAVLLLLCSL